MARRLNLLNLCWTRHRRWCVAGLLVLVLLAAWASTGFVRPWVTVHYQTRVQLVPVDPIIIAVEDGADIQALRQMLDANPERLNMQFGGNTLLHMAASRGREDLVTLLLDRGADVNARQGGLSYGRTPFVCALEHPGVVRILVERGADLNYRDSYGRTLEEMIRDADRPDLLKNLQDAREQARRPHRKEQPENGHRKR